MVRDRCSTSGDVPATESTLGADEERVVRLRRVGQTKLLGPAESAIAPSAKLVRRNTLLNWTNWWAARVSIPAPWD
jgi:hypothetical protein